MALTQTTIISLVMAFMLLFNNSFANEVVHTVGGDQGWDIHFRNLNWAAGKSFKAGDNLQFNFKEGLGHDLKKVSREDYDNCNTYGKAIDGVYFDKGPAVVKLKEGPNCFICTALGHCGVGMKLEVDAK